MNFKKSSARVTILSLMQYTQLPHTDLPIFREPGRERAGSGWTQDQNWRHQISEWNRPILTHETGLITSPHAFLWFLKHGIHLTPPLRLHSPSFSLSSRSSTGDEWDRTVPAAVANACRGCFTTVACPGAEVQSHSDGAESLQPLSHWEVPNCWGMVSS